MIGGFEKTKKILEKVIIEFILIKYEPIDRN